MDKLSDIRSNRNLTIDTMKFFLILAIYIGHYGTYSGLLFPFVSSFHVRVFFLLSGLWATKNCDKTVLSHATKGFKRYIIPWVIWVFINTVYNAILQGFDISRSLAAFIMYFQAVRGSAEVGGTWFVPCFFLVSLCYQFLLRLLVKMRIKGQFAVTSIILILSVCIYYLGWYVYRLPQNLIFSIHCIPEYLFCFSLGAVIHGIYSAIKGCIKQFLVVALSVVSVVYMAGAYFGYVDRLWGWIYRFPENPLYFLPETVRTLMAFFFVRFLAKLFASEFLANIGRATLILCLSESVMKSTIGLVANTFGLSANVTNPIQSLCFSTIVMVVAMRTAVPITNALTQKVSDFLLSVKCKCGKKQVPLHTPQ